MNPLQKKTSKRKINVGDFRLGPEEKNSIIEVLNSGRISEGAKVRRFEKLFSDFIGTEHSVVVNSGTSALIALLLALKYDNRFPKIRANAKIITSPITYIATANAIVLSGFEPVFVDIDAGTFSIMPEQVEEVLSKNRDCAAILPVHLMGYPCDMDALNDLAQKYNVTLIEDSSQAHGSLYKGKKTGSLAVAGTFSFYIAHNIQAGEMGAVTTDDELLAENIQRIKANGRLCSCSICTRSQNYCKLLDPTSETDEDDPRFTHTLIGANFKTMEFQAALGITQIKKADKIVKKRLENVQRLNDGLERFSKFMVLPKFSADVSYLAYPITIKEDAGISRRWLTSRLESHGIETRPLFGCIPTQQPAYGYLKPKYAGKLPNAEYIGKNSFYFGCHQYLTGPDIDYIIDVFSQIFKQVD